MLEKLHNCINLYNNLSKIEDKYIMNKREERKEDYIENLLHTLRYKINNHYFDFFDIKFIFRDVLKNSKNIRLKNLIKKNNFCKEIINN